MLPDVFQSCLDSSACLTKIVRIHHVEERRMPSVSVNDLDLNSSEAIRVTLEKFPGERVTLNLIGGGEL